MKNLIIILLFALTFCTEKITELETVELEVFEITVAYPGNYFTAVSSDDYYLNIVSVTSVPAEVNFYREYNLNVESGDSLLIDLGFAETFNYKFEFYINHKGINKVVTTWYDQGIDP